MNNTTSHTRVGLPALVLAAGLAALLSVSLQADDTDVAIHDAILMQIEAFANDDEAAWTYASDGIKRRFGSADVFLSMVREAYPAVHRPSSIEFVERVPHGPFEIQVVRLEGPQGKRWDAFYRMVLTKGVWKIAGVRLQPADLGI